MKYDLIVIGAGPAGYHAGISAGARGRKVLVVDKREPGGTCLHAGCVPSSFFYHVSHFFLKLESFKKKGIFQGQADLNWEALQKSKDGLIQSLQKGISYLFKKNSVEFKKGRARIDREGRVILCAGEGEESFLSEKILIATGSREHIPPELAGLPYHTGESVWNMEKLPASMTVIGAGVVGTEIALIFSFLGVKITLIEAAGEILSFLDDDLRRVILVRLREKGVRILTGSPVTEGYVKEGSVCLRLKDGAEIISDRLVLSAGRKPDTEAVRELPGVNMKNGFIEADRQYRTSRNNLYAAGDVINAGKMFAHLAREQARDCARILYEPGYEPAGLFLPYGLFTFPQVAGIGMTERELAASGRPFSVKKASSLAVPSGKILDLKDGFLKILLSRDGKEILGAHLAAENAVELVSILSFMFNNRLTADPDFLGRTLFLHPSESEIFSEIFFQ